MELRGSNWNLIDELSENDVILRQATRTNSSEC